MLKSDFETIVDHRVKRTLHLLVEKAKHYASSDRLHNFKEAAKVSRNTPIESCMNFFSKPFVCIQDLVAEISNEVYNDEHIKRIDEIFGDAVAYLILLEALFKEKLLDRLDRDTHLEQSGKVEEYPLKGLSKEDMVQHIRAVQARVVEVTAKRKKFEVNDELGWYGQSGKSAYQRSPLEIIKVESVILMDDGWRYLCKGIWYAENELEKEPNLVPQHVNLGPQE